MDAKVAEFRARYREERISPGYRGWLHFLFTSLGSLAAIALSILQVADVQTWEWSIIPGTFLFANFVEYKVHRGPMHHRTPGLGLLFKRHTLEHHRFFTESHMEHEGSRDFAAVLFPPFMLVFFIGTIVAPTAAALFLLVSSNLAWLFAATVVAYYLNYEWLHFAYHLSDAGRIARLPMMSTLRRLHSRHHNPQEMTTANFNITYPIFDLAYRTYRR